MYTNHIKTNIKSYSEECKFLLAVLDSGYIYLDVSYPCYIGTPGFIFSHIIARYVRLLVIKETACSRTFALNTYSNE